MPGQSGRFGPPPSAAGGNGRRSSASQNAYKSFKRKKLFMSSEARGRPNFARFDLRQPRQTGPNSRLPTGWDPFEHLCSNRRIRPGGVINPVKPKIKSNETEKMGFWRNPSHLVFTCFSLCPTTIHKASIQSGWPFCDRLMHFCLGSKFGLPLKTADEWKC